MFKDVFVLKKNSWHARLMTYIWGYKPHDFTHMCPYWWLSVFNVLTCWIVVPVKFVFKLLFVSIGWAIEKATRHFEASYEEQMKSYLAQYKANPEAFSKKYIQSLHTPVLVNKAYYKFFRGYLHNHDWNGYRDVRLKHNEYVWEMKNKKEDRFQSYIPIKQKINASLKWVKPVVRATLYVLGVATAIAGLYFIYWLFSLMANIPSTIYVEAFKWITIILLGILIFVIALLGLNLLLEKLKYTKGFGVNGGRIVDIVVHSFIKTITAIEGVIKFLIQMVKDNCPAVKWVD